MATAILIDGAYFIKRFRAIEPASKHDYNRAGQAAVEWALAHLHRENDPTRTLNTRADLYRIFFYDCPPVEKKMHNPITKAAIDFKNSDEAVFRRGLHEYLKKERKVALRLGHLSNEVDWTLKSKVIQQLLKKQISLAQLTADSVTLSVRQKGVDMRIGIDITSIVLKKQATQIVLIAGDSDFVPAAKLARREGVDFVLDSMWGHIHHSLHEHVDGLRTTCPKPGQTGSVRALWFGQRNNVPR